MKIQFALSLVLALLVLSYCQDYCQVSSPAVDVFMGENENRVLDLSGYIQGYNLRYKTDTKDSNQIIQVVHQRTSTQLQFEAGYRLVCIAKYNKINSDKVIPGAIVAIKDGNSIAVAELGFSEANQSLSIYQYRSNYKLPENSTCFSAVVINDAYTVVVNCQNSKASKNYLCVLKRDKVAVCQSSQAQLSTSVRKTELYTINNVTLLLSADIKGDTEDSTIDIWSINNDEIKLEKKVTKDDLQLSRLLILDLTVDLQGSIVIASLNSEDTFDIVSFKYSKGSVLQVTNLVENMKGQPTAIKIVNNDILFIATRQKLIQATYPEFKSLKQYQLGSNKTITEIHANNDYIIFQTLKDRHYIYKRGQTKSNLTLYEQQKSESSFLHILSFANSYLVIDRSRISQREISNGYLTLLRRQQDTNFTLTGTSEKISCNVYIRVKIINSTLKILTKKGLDGKSFVLASDQKLSLILDEYFGGGQLSYEISRNVSSDIKSSLLQILKYTIKNIPIGMDLYQVVGIDVGSFYLIAIKVPLIIIKKCKVDALMTIQCQDYWQYDNLDETVISMHGIRRNNKELFVVFCYKDTHRYTYLNLSKPIYNWYFRFDEYHYSQVVIGQKYTFFTLKHENLISIRFNDISTEIFGKSSFSQKELDLMDGFYPREIRISPNNPSIFYVKTFKGICTMGVNQVTKTVHLIDYLNIFNSYFQDEIWSFVVGTSTLFLIFPDFIIQYHHHTHQPLHTNLELILTLPVHYDQITDTVFGRTKDGNTVMIRLNSIALDSVIYKDISAGYKMSVSWGWVVIPESNTAYIVPKRSQLEISANIPKNKTVNTYQYYMTVNSQDTKLPIKFNLTYLNYKPNYNQNTMNSLNSHNKREEISANQLLREESVQMHMM